MAGEMIAVPTGGNRHRRRLLNVILVIPVLIVGCGQQEDGGRESGQGPTVAEVGSDAGLAEVAMSSSDGERASKEDAAADVDLALGRAIFENNCLTCHGVPASGAPQLRDHEAWRKRIAQGFDVLMRHALLGHRDMPPKGGMSNLSDEQVAAAVGYVVDQSGRIIQDPHGLPRLASCESGQGMEGCSPERARKALILHMLWLLSGKR